MLLYSKYSKHCIDLLNIITINEIAGFTNVCIDEPQIRDRVLKSSTLKIRQVPCIVSEDKQVYEGELAFRLVNSIIDANAPPMPSNTTSSTDTSTSMNTNSSTNTSTSMNTNSSTNTNNPPQQKKTYTSIEDIVEDSSEEPPRSAKDDFQDRYSNMHVNAGSELKSKSKKMASRVAELEKERNAPSDIPPPDCTAMRVSSLNDVGLDLSKGRRESPIKSVKTGAPINVNKLMSAIESRT
jgi:hypothetical protein